MPDEETAHLRVLIANEQDRTCREPCVKESQKCESTQERRAPMLGIGPSSTERGRT